MKTFYDYPPPRSSGTTNLLPPQPTHFEPVQSATDYFEEIREKVMRNIPEKAEKSLDYWIARTEKKRCIIHPSKLSKTCR